MKTVQIMQLTISPEKYTDTCNKMKLIQIYIKSLLYFFLFFFPTFFFQIAMAKGEDIAINFNSALKLALKNNPLRTGSLAKINEAKAHLDTAKGNDLPTLSLNENISRSNNPLNVFGYRLMQRQATFSDFGLSDYTGPSSVGVTPTALDNPGYAQNYDTGVVLAFPLYSGGRNRALIHQAQSALEAAREGDTNACNLLAYDLLQAYAGVNNAHHSLRAAIKAYSAAASEAKIASNLFKQGLVTQSDVLLTKSRVAQSEVNIESAKSAVGNEIDTFRTIIGEPDSHFIPGMPVVLDVPTESVQQIQDKALHSNPALLAAKARWESDLDGVMAARSANWPQINLTLRHDWNALTPTLRAPSNTAMLDFSWKILDFGTRSGTITQSKAKAEIAQSEYISTVNQLQLKIAESFRRLKVAKARLQASLDSEKQSREATRLLLLRYQQGLATLSQVLESQASSDAANFEYIQSEYIILLATAQIRYLENSLYSHLVKITAIQKEEE